jgi:hypothetical protein
MARFLLASRVVVHGLALPASRLCWRFVHGYVPPHGLAVQGIRPVGDRRWSRAVGTWLL